MLSRVCCILTASRSPKTIFVLMCVAGALATMGLLYASDIRHLFSLSFPTTNSGDKPDFHAFGHGADRICPFAGLNTTSVIFVNSAPRNVLQRQTIRSTWGHPNITNPLSLGIMFMIAEVEDPAIQSLVDWEASIYGDVAQGTFRDTYESLAKKSLYGVSWVLKYCGKSRYVIKTDDNVFVHAFALRRFLDEQDPDGNSLFCLVLSDIPVLRHSGVKGTMKPTVHFNGSFFPKYCSGSAYIMPMPVARAVFNASSKVPEFSAEDVYVTGILAQFAGVSHRQIGNYYDLRYENERDLVEGKIIFAHLNEDREIPETRVWDRVLEKEKNHWKKTDLTRLGRVPQ